MRVDLCPSGSVLQVSCPWKGCCVASLIVAFDLTLKSIGSALLLLLNRLPKVVLEVIIQSLIEEMEDKGWVS